MPQDFNPVSAPEPFEITTFLLGRTRAWGVFEDRFGKLRRRFTVILHGHWKDDVFCLDETFKFDTGDVEVRKWLVRPSGDGRFVATCDDCVGELRGSTEPNVLRMRYKFRLDLGTTVLVVDFDDRIYRMGQHTAVNRATMRKYGVRLGELSLFFSKVPAAMEDIEPEGFADLVLDPAA